jgi:hypothetical protein
MFSIEENSTYIHKMFLTIGSIRWVNYSLSFHSSSHYHRLLIKWENMHWLQKNQLCGSFFFALKIRCPNIINQQRSWCLHSQTPASFTIKNLFSSNNQCKIATATDHINRLYGYILLTSTATQYLTHRKTFLSL